MVLLPAMQAVAQPTGELELREGFMDPQSGVTVEKITTLPGQEFQEIYLSVPKATGELEEVIVTAPRLENKTIEQKKTYTFVRDFDHNHYGLILYLGKEVRLPIRLYLDAVQIQPGDIEMP
jgi:hypothetical protein